MPAVEAFIASMVTDYHQSQDIMQETAIVLAEKMDEFDENRSFIAWAIGIAKNKILSSKRRHARHPLLYDSELVERIGAVCEDISEELFNRTRKLDQCIKTLNLNGRSRKVFNLRYQDNLKPGKIADRIGMTAGNVRVVLNRLRGTLRKCMEKPLRYEQV